MKMEHIPASGHSYFFCGIGGSGMSALAAILALSGARVRGSDRARDKGDSPVKFARLQDLGIDLFPQDGSGVDGALDWLVVSTAVEDSIPDVRAAKDKNVRIIKRAELLATLLNAAPTSVAVAGTSGKSTVTGMIAVMLAACGLDPTIMNGGMILNFMEEGHKGLANMRVGKDGVFVAETDESDGSIALYNPSVAVLNNISLDHKTLEELDTLFGDFIGRASRAVILNADDGKVFALARRAKAPVLTYGLEADEAGLRARNLSFTEDYSTSFDLEDKSSGKTHAVRIRQPGAHNVSNALAALCVAKALGLDMEQAIPALEKFQGIGRRMEITGSRNGVTVIDDFGHNPDKIAATLRALKLFPGRLIVMFQPHGFGPLKLMGAQMVGVFAEYFGPEDILLMPEAYYAGGTVDRSVTAKDIIGIAKGRGIDAHWFEKRAETLPFIASKAKKGDRVVVMGARDDTLSDFAREILGNL
jgi:UDP-N-acetylmuramate--alanine ligase